MIIVILIMAILAVVVIPQIAGTKREAALTNLKGDLAVMRKAVEIYYVQHNSTYPGAKSIAGMVLANESAANTAFAAQLLGFTSVNGEVSKTKDDSHKFGPYIKGGKLPINPFNRLRTVICDMIENDITVRTSDGLSGWKFYVQTGVLIANDGAHDHL